MRRAQNIIKSTMPPDVVQGHVTGLIAVALSQQSANGMRFFREALREVISERLVLRLRSSSPSDLQRNAPIADMCILGKNHHPVTLRKATVLRYLNGDWTQRKHNCSGPPCWKDRDHCISIDTSIVVTAVACYAPPTFPRSRSAGSVEAIGWPLLPGSALPLLSSAYLLLASRQWWNRRTSCL